MVETVVSVIVIWFVISLIAFLLFATVNEISYRFTKLGRIMFYVAFVVVELPLLMLMSVLYLLWLLAYPLHLIFVKKEYRKSFIEYALIKESLI